ncbi:hypothetical protein ACFY3U_22635 [Micromonospora sp. NPDC000089]|uniref:hypothetical protein n=1 Tax=unclassified Micromonospora TaxID=2617518 RepID=UPI0036B22369
MTDVLPRSSDRPPATAGCVRLQSWWSHDDPTAAWQERQIRRCDAILHGLAVATPFTVDDLCTVLERVRGRQLVVSTLRTRHTDARAMWCRGATTDHILLGSAHPRLHRDHLILHGIGHMIFDHVGSPAVGRDIRKVLPAADGAGMRRGVKRVVHTQREERQAEVFATRVLQLSDTWGAPEPPTESRALLEQLSSALEYHPGRAEH